MSGSSPARSLTGLAKINPSFLSGEVLDEALRWSGPLRLPGALRTPTGLLAMSRLVIGVELFLAFGLWLRRLRPAAFVLGLGLHLFIVVWIPFYGLQLLVFAIESLAIYVLFLEPGPIANRLFAGLRPQR